MFTVLPSRWAVILILWSGLCSTPGVAQQTSRPTTQNLEPGFRIAGTVTNAIGGNPLPRARITISDVKNPQNVQEAIASDDGYFEFKHLSAGKYSLRGEKRGFIGAAYDEHEYFSTAIVTGAGVDTEHLVLRLAPNAVISGRVLDEAGEPVRNASLRLYGEDRRSGIGRIRSAGFASTDDRGSYEFSPLQAGTYFLSVYAAPWYAIHPPSSGQQETGNTLVDVDQSLDVAYPVAYYKDATSPDEASPIPVRGGDHLEVDFTLSPVHALRLVFHFDGDGPRYPTLQRPAFDGMEFVPTFGAQMVSPGEFEVNGIAPGHYTVRMPETAPGESQQSQASETEIDLTSDGQELDMSKAKPVSTLKASVKLLGEPALPKQLGVLLRNSNRRLIAYQLVNEKGEAEFPSLAPDKYEVLVQAPGGKAYSVLGISVDGREHSGHNLEVTAGASINIVVSAFGSAMRVEGFARRAGKAAPGVMVVLVPQNPDAHYELFRRDQSDLDGSFGLRGVIPGSYTLCAIENGWELDWAKSAVIADYCRHGNAVTIPVQPDGILRLSDPVEVQPR